MSKSKTDRRSLPVATPLDPEVVAFRRQFNERSPLDELIQEGARRMLQTAIDAEVDSFIDRHQDRRDTEGRRLVVKNGSLPAREILTAAGMLEVQQGRVRDNSPNRSDRVQFTPSVLPAYLRRTDAIEELIPWLYLKGVSTGDFQEALQAIVGEKAKGLSANVVVTTIASSRPIAGLLSPTTPCGTPSASAGQRRHRFITHSRRFQAV